MGQKGHGMVESINYVAPSEADISDVQNEEIWMIRKEQQTPTNNYDKVAHAHECTHFSG